MSIKPCTNGPRHKWVWKRNTASTSMTARTIGFSLRGVYRCECGASKIGAPNHNGPDLRGLIQEQP